MGDLRKWYGCSPKELLESAKSMRMLAEMIANKLRKDMA